MIDDIDAFLKRLAEVTGKDNLDERMYGGTYFSHNVLHNIKMITGDVNKFVEIWRDNPVDFVHDFRTGFFFISMFACHQMLMSQLYEAYTGDSSLNTDDAADKYIDLGMGVFRSSQSTRIWYSTAAVIPAGLKYLWRRELELL
jgi:hypothetical protein